MDVYRSVHLKFSFLFHKFCQQYFQVFQKISKLMATKEQSSDQKKNMEKSTQEDEMSRMPQTEKEKEQPTAFDNKTGDHAKEQNEKEKPKSVEKERTSGSPNPKEGKEQKTAGNDQVTSPAEKKDSKKKEEKKKEKEKELQPRSEQSPVEVPKEQKSQMSVMGMVKTTTKDYQFLEEYLIKMPFYHGFVAREDVHGMLKNVGDFLVRTSVQANKQELEKRKKNAANAVKWLDNLSREQLAKKEMEATKKIAAAGEVGRREFVISVNCKDKTSKKSPSRPNYTPVRNLVIKRDRGLISVEPQKKFKTLSEFFEWYKKTSGACKETTFMLSNPIPLSSWEYHHEDIDLQVKRLGEGAFGEVCVGKIKNKDGKLIEVAVKMLRNSDFVSRDQVGELLHEARIMRMMDHKNILRSAGIAVLQEPLYLMSEICALGALREYLKEHKDKITLGDKLNFVIGAARGVEYLHSKKTIHRDLAVRNILLAEDKTPKISDFGLSRVVETDKYVMKEACKIPVRYLAPETVQNFTFTFKTDVYSFGCVIWEIYENGQQPYDGKNTKTIKKIIKNNQFLKLSTAAPSELRKLLSMYIFTADPENRYTMASVVKAIEKIEKPK